MADPRTTECHIKEVRNGERPLERQITLAGKVRSAGVQGQGAGQGRAASKEHVELLRD